jgi:hypothetical protein
MSLGSHKRNRTAKADIEIGRDELQFRIRPTKQLGCSLGSNHLPVILCTIVASDPATSRQAFETSEHTHCALFRQ